MEIVNIKLEQLKIHPNNIRKEYDGIDELAQSIRENGIMQNLTVVPDKDEAGTYFVVIGNRRLTAARQAGIESAPCIIVDNMSDKDQITTMLTENMNRKDLKIYEEAAAVQMCMKDFGFDMEEMEKKTGLSKTTLHHRLNLAKLDQKTLRKRANEADFQLTLNDLYALEKIEDVKVRNKILKEAQNSRDLLNKARYAENDQTCDKNAKTYIEMCKKRGIAEAPKGTENEIYMSSKWHTVKYYFLLDKPPARIMAQQGELFWCRRSQYFYILEKSKTQEKGEKKLTKAELEAKEREKGIKHIKARYKEMFNDMGDFIRNIFAGKIPMIENKELLQQMVWKHIVDSQTWISLQDVAATIMGKDFWKGEADECEENIKKARTLPIMHQMLAVAYWKMREPNIIGYFGKYEKDYGERLKYFYNILELFGYSWPDEECEQIANGTHEKYVTD